MSELEHHARLARIETQMQRIETIMQESNLYASERPSRDAFKSSVPFCYDTMSLVEWLQWVMFPKTRELLRKNLPLPTVCEIHPLAEEEFKRYTQDTNKLLDAILELDKLFNIQH